MHLRWLERTVDCDHHSTISAIQSGLERVVCEDCGDVTVRYQSTISGKPTRDQFARHADELFLKKLLAVVAQEDEVPNDAHDGDQSAEEPLKS